MHYEVDYTGVVKDKKTEDKDKVRKLSVQFFSFYFFVVKNATKGFFLCRVR